MIEFIKDVFKETYETLAVISEIPRQRWVEFATTIVLATPILLVVFLKL